MKRYEGLNAEDFLSGKISKEETTPATVKENSVKSAEDFLSGIESPQPSNVMNETTEALKQVPRAAYGSLVAPMAGAAVGGYKAIASVFTSDKPEAADIVEKEIKRFKDLYPTTTKGGKKIEDIIAYPFEKIQEGIKFVSDSMFDYAELKKQNALNIEAELNRWNLSPEEKKQARQSFAGWSDEPYTPQDSALIGASTETLLNAILMAVPLGKRQPKEGAQQPKVPVSRDAPAVEGGEGLMAKTFKEPDVIDHGPVPAVEALGSKLPEGIKAVMDEERSVGAAQARGLKTPSTAIEFLGEVGDSIKRVYKAVEDFVGGKAISPVREAAEYSPTLRSFVDKIEAPEVPQVATGATYWERLSRETGRYATAVEAAVEPFRTAVRGALKAADDLNLVKGLRGQPVPLKYEKSVKVLRSTLDDTLQYMRDAGLKVKKLTNYFPRVYDLKNMKKGENDFIRKLMDHGIPADEAELIHRRIMREEGFIDDMRLDRINTPGGFKNPHAESLRKLNKIPDRELEPFLVNSVPKVLNKYIEWATNRTEWARVFGPNGENLRKAERDIKQELMQSGYRGNALARLGDIANAMQRTYHPIRSQGWKATQRGVIAYQYARTMLRATLSSATEPFVIFSRGHTRAGLKGMLRGIEHAARETARVFYKGIPEAEATRAARQAGLALQEAIIERMVATFGGDVTRFTTAYFKSIGLSQWTRFNRVWANEAGKYMIIDNLKDLNRGGKPKWITKKYERELTELGIDIEQGKQWVKNGMRKDDPFYEQIVTGGIRFTNEVVMHPRASNRPMWHSNPHVKMFTQLKGFQTTFGNTVVKRMVRDMTQRGAPENVLNITKNAIILTMMTYVAMLINELWDNVKFKDGKNPKKKTQTTRIMEAIDKTGVTGAPGFFWDAILATQYGRSPFTAIAGPMAGQMDDAARALYHAGAKGNMRPLAKLGLEGTPVIASLPTIKNQILDEVAPKKNR